MARPFGMVCKNWYLESFVVIKPDGAGADVKGQYAGCFASGQPLTEVTRNTLSFMSGSLRRSLPPGEGVHTYIKCVDRAYWGVFFD